jgi:hypothetical protein
VTGSGSFTVTITATTPTGQQTLVSTLAQSDASGFKIPCLGTAGKNAGGEDICTLTAGNYQFHLVAHPSDGSLDRTEVRGFSVGAPTPQ